MLLGVIKRIIIETIDTLPSQVGCDLVRLASSEMTASKVVKDNTYYSSGIFNKVVANRCWKKNKLVIILFFSM